MKKKSFFLFFTLTLAIFSLCLIVSCSNDIKDDDKFFDTYKKILIIRNENTDTSSANISVRKLLKELNYTEQSFRDEFTRLAQDPNKFAKKIDSVRKIAIE